MPSSSARCAQLPRAVDKVPFYVALRKLRDHLCGRLPLLRDAEVCFPDVKLKIESNSEEGAIKVEPADEDQDDLRYPGSTSMFEGPLSGPRTALLQSQRNFHQHPLGRAALAAAAAAGGYLEVSLARAGFTGTAPPGRSSKHSSSVVRDAKKKSSSSKKKKKKSDFGSHSASSCDSDPEVKRKIKMENSDSEAQGSCGTEHGTNDNGPCGSPQQHIQQRHHGALSGSPLGNEYRSPTPKPTPPVQHVQRPTPHPHPLSAYGSLSNTTYQTQMSPSPSLPTDHPPLYSSPVGPGYHSHHQTPLHIKQEKMDPMETSRLGSPSPSLNSTGAVSPSLLGGYPSPVGCLYSASGSATSNYGAGPPQAPSPYFGSPSPQNPYGSYHHSSLNPLLPLGHHHHHHAHQLAPPQGGPSHSSADLYASANGLHHHHHLQPMGTPHESQYYGVPGQGSGVNGAPYSPHMPHKDASPPTSVATAFHQYPSPSSAYHQHTHLHQPPNGAPPQYCPPPPLPDAGAVQNPTAITGVYDHQATSPAPLYTNLENVKVKQERLDPTYGEY